MSKETQMGKILAYCDKYGSITVRDAVVELNINSPRKVISDLRKAGYDVQAVEEVKAKPDGEKVRYKRYFIRRGEVS